MQADQLCVLAPLRIEASALRNGATSAEVVRTGMGPTRSRRAGSRLADELEPAQPVAIAGLCGALAPDLRPGDVIIANTVSSPGGDIWLELPGAALVAAELQRRGVPARAGPILSTDHLVTGRARGELADRGWIAADMESAWLAKAMSPAESARSLIVARVVVDTPGRELWSLGTPGRMRLARKRLAEIVRVLERWAGLRASRTILLAGPRSFCAGVDRAIDIVERALDKFRPPVYVRRQIVHNSHVVAELERKGAVFVEEVDEVPPGSTLVLAAHGVAPEVRGNAAERHLRVIDATCPLVAKVHTEARRFAQRGYDIVLIGHDDHEEVEGTYGEAPDAITVVASEADVDELDVRDPERVAYLTQTTLATDEVADIVEHLQDRYPSLTGPHRDDICYATQNRQEAVAAIAPDADVVLVVGSANSSNSKRLVEVAERAGSRSHLIDGCGDIQLDWIDGATSIGVTAGASAPESKVSEVVAALGSLGPITVEERAVIEENVSFRLPPEVRA